MERTFEATIEKRARWYIGWVDAVPGALSQGKTIKEVQENLKESVQLILESQRELRDEGTAESLILEAAESACPMQFPSEGMSAWKDGQHLIRVRADFHWWA